MPATVRHSRRTAAILPGRFGRGGARPGRAPGRPHAAAGRDGAVRHGQTAAVDAQNRVNLGKALTALGWMPQTFLDAAREDDRLVVRGGATLESWELTYHELDP